MTKNEEAAAARMQAVLEGLMHRALRGVESEYDSETNTKITRCGRRVHVSRIVGRFNFNNWPGAAVCQECRVMPGVQGPLGKEGSG